MRFLRALVVILSMSSSAVAFADTVLMANSLKFQGVPRAEISALAKQATKEIALPLIEKNLKHDGPTRPEIVGVDGVEVWGTSCLATVYFIQTKDAGVFEAKGVFCGLPTKTGSYKPEMLTIADKDDKTATFEKSEI